MCGPLAEIFGVVNLFLTFAIIGIIFPYFIWFFTKIKQLEIIDQEMLLKAEQVEEIEEVAEVPEIVQVAPTVE